MIRFVVDLRKAAGWVQVRAFTRRDGTAVLAHRRAVNHPASVFQHVRDDELLGRASKMKTPIDIPTRMAMLRMGVGKFPAPGVDPASIQVHLDRDHRAGAVMTWVDTAGRSQRAYSDAFLSANAEKKWERVTAFRQKFEGVRTAIRDTLSKAAPGSDDQQAATIAAIIAETGLRPGGREDSVAAGHYGISDLLGSHVQPTEDGRGVALKFVGKSGKENNTEVRDPVTVAAIRHLAQHAGSGPLFTVGPERARALLPPGMKLKDMRTIIATETAERALHATHPPPPLPGDPEAAKKLIAKRFVEASKVVAEKLNNTPAIARAAYIHPEVVNAWTRSVGGAHLVTDEP